MSVTIFLSNDTLWQTLTARIKAANHVDAAIAYFGQGGAKLLPLRLLRAGAKVAGWDLHPLKNCAFCTAH